MQYFFGQIVFRSSVLVSTSAIVSSILPLYHTVEISKLGAGATAWITNTLLDNKKLNLDKLLDEEKNNNSEVEGIKDLKENKLDKHLEKLLELISVLEKDKEILEGDIKNITNEKTSLIDEINILEKKQREANASYNGLNNELKNKEIHSGKLEVKLDNLLESLSSEYNLTYEFANTNYSLDMEPDIARSKVNKLKREFALSSPKYASANDEIVVKNRDDKDILINEQEISKEIGR